MPKKKFDIEHGYLPITGTEPEEPSTKDYLKEILDKVRYMEWDIASMKKVIGRANELFIKPEMVKFKEKALTKALEEIENTQEVGSQEDVEELISEIEDDLGWSL